MPPIDVPQVLVALAAAAVTYFWNRRSPSAPPPGPAAPPQLPDLQSPLVQGLLVLLKQVLEKNQKSS